MSAAEQVIKPLVTPALAEQLLLELYGLKASECKELPGYDDRNFVLAVCEGREEEGEEERRVLLKVNSIEESDKRIHRQNAIMHLLSEAGFPVQSVMKSLKGLTLEKWSFRTPADTTGRLIDRQHAVRLLTFLPGKLLADAESMTKELMESVGRELGRLDRFLTQKILPQSEGDEKHQVPPWSFFFISKVRQFTRFVTNETDRTMAEQVVNKFITEVLETHVHKLTPAFIHGDPNESNFLVTESHPEQLSGVIDWQDLQEAFAEFDLAILIMSISLVVAKQQRPGCDPLLSTAPHLIRGFTETFPLPRENLSIMPLIVAARYAQVLVMSTYAYSRDPGNEYLLTTVGGWSVLRDMWGRDGEGLREMGEAWAKESEAASE